jgi:hypothetical protein
VVACFPVSIVLPPPLDSTFGAIAESIIGGRFLDSVGRRAMGFFPSSVTQEDFQDISIGIGNIRLHILYCDFHNRLSAARMLALGTSRIPDLITHTPSRSSTPRRAEFYEIKPNSPSGLADGAAKIAMVKMVYGIVALPYVPGTVWTPDEKILISRGAPLGIKLEVFFHYKWITPGLIDYEICVEGDLEKIALALLLAILAIILALILKGGRLPVPMPAPPVVA